MKAVLQNFSNGKLSVSDVPPPAIRPEGILVHNARSLISGGTERAVIELANMNPLMKAKTRPDLVKKVMAKAGQEGLLGTAKIVKNLVSAPIPLGYSSAGVVVQVGSAVTGFTPGDRVACAGLGYANHAECAYIPQNLAVKVPNGVTLDHAAFTTVGAIAVQAVRQAETEFGQTVLVIGLGLIGQIVSQVCTAAGCRVFGIEPDKSKLAMAVELGIEDGATPDSASLDAQIDRFTRGRGVDAVIIAASTKSSGPVEAAAHHARNRAKIVALGDINLNIPRRAYYEKELDLRQSRSYGPGRYDSSYEEHGVDYPIEYVRWTENRNMEAFLDMVDAGRVQIDPLVTGTFSIEDAEAAYATLLGDEGRNHLGILLQYDQPTEQPVRIVTAGGTTGSEIEVRIGVIGAGQFAQGILLPHIRRHREARIVAVANPSGVTARSVADKYRASYACAEPQEIIRDTDINTVMVCGRHESHAALVASALDAGKHVFVEKPLALGADELDEIGQVLAASGHPCPLLMVGYNRRFSPFAVALQDAFQTTSPLFVNVRVNAGPIPADHWTQDPQVGGGRILGEVCHYVDLSQYLIGSKPETVTAIATKETSPPSSDPDTLSVQIGYANGSVAAIQYVANGDPRLPKERVEVFGGGQTGLIDNWRSAEIYKRGKRTRDRSWFSSKKGHAEEIDTFVNAVRTGVQPISTEDLFETSRVTFAIRRSLRVQDPVQLKDVA